MKTKIRITGSFLLMIILIIVSAACSDDDSSGAKLSLVAPYTYYLLTVAWKWN